MTGGGGSDVSTTGRCLCGAVRWSTDATLREIFECHCDRCRRLTGNHMAASAVPTARLDIATRPGALNWYSPIDDANVAYGFCSTCGSSLFYRSGVADGTNTITAICAGSFDRDPGLRTIEIWFADRAASHIRLARSGDSVIVVHPDQPTRNPNSRGP